MKTLAGTFVIVGLLLCGASAASAQLVDSRLFQAPVVSTASAPVLQFPAGARIAVIDFRSIAEKSRVGKRVLVELQAFQDKKTAEIQGMQSQLQALQNQRQTQAALLAEAALAVMDRNIGKLSRSLQHAQQDAQAELDDLRAELMADVQKKIGAVVVQVAKEKDILVVFEADSTVYFQPGLDLSDEIVKRLDAQTTYN
jgi:outer membrane protein